MLDTATADSRFILIHELKRNVTITHDQDVLFEAANSVYKLSSLLNRIQKVSFKVYNPEHLKLYHIDYIKIIIHTI